MVGLSQPARGSASGTERGEMERLFPHSPRIVSVLENAGKDKQSTKEYKSTNSKINHLTK